MRDGLIVVVSGAICGLLIVNMDYHITLLFLTPLIVLFELPLVLGKRGIKENLVYGNWNDSNVSSWLVGLSWKRTRGLFIIGGIILLLLNLYSPAQPTIIERLLASLLTVVGSLPLLFWISGTDRGIPFLPLFGFIYVSYYALPIFVMENYSWYETRSISDSSIEYALCLSILGIVFLFLGYYGVQNRMLSRAIPKINMPWLNNHTVKRWGMVFGVIGIGFYYISITSEYHQELKQIIYVLQNLSLLSIIILFVLQLSGHLSLSETLFLWIGLIPARLFLAMGTGAAAQILQVILLLILAYTTVKQRVPWKTLVGGVLTLVLLLPARTDFRTLTWGGVDSDRSPIEKSILFLSIAGDFLTGEKTSYLDMIQATASRLAHLITFAMVVDLTPSTVPYWNGETYYPLLSKPIPRILFRDKSTEITGQTFGHRYGFLIPEDDTTSENLPQLIEFYVNFGLIGVLVGMFLMGTLYKSLQTFFFHRGVGLAAMVMGIYTFSKLIFIESALSGSIGGLYWDILIFISIYFVLKGTRNTG